MGMHNPCYGRTFFLTKHTNCCNVSITSDLYLRFFACGNYSDCTLPRCWKTSLKNLLQTVKNPNRKERQKNLLQNCWTSSKVAKETAPKLAPNLPNNLLQNLQERLRTCSQKSSSNPWNHQIAKELAPKSLKKLLEMKKKIAPNHQELAPKSPSSVHQSPLRNHAKIIENLLHSRRRKN